MAFDPKDWQDYPSEATPLSAAAMEDLETRLSDYTDTVATGLQPSDADLTAIAALSTTAFGRSVLAAADAAALRTLADAQPLDSDLTAIAALTTTAFGRGFLDLADAAAARTKLALGALATAADVSDAQVNASAAIQGSKLDTADGRLKKTVGFVTATSSPSLTTSYQDVPGATVTFTPDVACYALVQAAFELEAHTDVVGAQVVSGILVVDGTPQGRGAYLAVTNNNAANVVVGGTYFQTYRIALSAASHTLKLQAKKSSTDTAACYFDNTNFSYQLTAQ
jgi:hypothetical protein